MKHYQYVIVGGGMTGDAALRGIREIDPSGSVAIISEETSPPYNRPPLSKKLWKGKSVDKIWRGTEQRDAELILNRRIVSLDPKQRLLRDDQGEDYQYERLLLATGGRPRTIPNSPPGVIYYRTLADYYALRKLTEQKKRCLVIGGGYIGSELAAALNMNGLPVQMVFSGPGIASRLLPQDLSQRVNELYRQKGVDLHTNQRVSSIALSDGEYTIRTENGQEYKADVVVAGLGIEPNIELAEQAGLHIDNGIVVDSTLRTTDPNIFAAGDVANFPTQYVFGRMRYEHEENANLSGMVAGKAMAGATEEYGTLPMSYSDLFEMGYESVGQISSKLETLADWAQPLEKGVIYYLQDGRVAGVLTLNIFGKMEAARQLIAETGPFPPENLHGRIPIE